MYEARNKFDVTLKAYESLKKKVESMEKDIRNKTIFLGFDGYIDSLYSLVKSRENSTTWTKMESLKNFGEYLIKIAGSSGNIERVLKRKISGGFAPNSAKAINGLGTKVFLLGALGYPTINDTFSPILSSKTVEAISFSNPGETAGLEFDDGKIMITDFENINNISWKLIKDRVPRDVLVENLKRTHAIGFGHWSLLPNMTDIWKNLLKEVFPSIKNLKEKLLFVDLSDVKKRTKSDINKMLKTLKNVDEQIPVMLSLNDQEAVDISKALDNVKKIDPTKKNFVDYEEGGALINKEVNLSYLVVHSPHFATISTKSNHYWVTEGFTSRPRFTTGAGDHFHSGVAIGLTCGLSPAEALVMGNALTAIFVRTGNSPNLQELSVFVKKYIEYIEIDNPNYP